jgi:phosphoglycerate dehydrogenase-like enzyme
MENVIFTPHVAARGGNDVAEFCKFFTENLRRYRAGEELMSLIGPERLAAAE